MSFAQNLKEIRLSQNKTILEVEKNTGIKNANISRWENGKVVPGIDMCIKLSEYYGVTLDDLVGQNGNFVDNGLLSQKGKCATFDNNFILSKEEKKLLEQFRCLGKAERFAVALSCETLYKNLAKNGTAKNYKKNDMF